MAAPDAVPEVTVTCPQGELTSLLMGSCGLEGLLRLGAAQADDAEKAQELGTAAALGAEAVAQRGLLRGKTAKGRGRR